MLKSDPNRILRLLPLVVGILGGTLLLLNRLATPALTNSQSRSDALGILLSALLILTGLLWQRIQARSPEAVTLIGTEGFELDATLPDLLQTELAWASHSLLTNTPTQSIAIWVNGQTYLRRGVLGPEKIIHPGPIVQRALTTGKPIYLVALALYPGRTEFNYLPENVQGLICQPIGPSGVMVLGANAPRSYTQQDEAWVTAIAQKLEVAIATAHLSPIAPD
ncbi:MAG: cofactor assembly of complex C subunit B [Thermosynechococcaceae cyanobacterium]